MTEIRRAAWAAVEREAAAAKRRDDEGWRLPRALDAAIRCQTIAEFPEAVVAIAAVLRERSRPVGRLRPGTIAEAGRLMIVDGMKRGFHATLAIQSHLGDLLVAQRVTWAEFIREDGRIAGPTIIPSPNEVPRTRLPIGDDVLYLRHRFFRDIAQRFGVYFTNGFFHPTNAVVPLSVAVADSVDQFERYEYEPGDLTGAVHRLRDAPSDPAGSERTKPPRSRPGARRFTMQAAHEVVADHERVRVLREQGRSLRAIAAELKMSYRQVRTIAKGLSAATGIAHSSKDEAEFDRNREGRSAGQATKKRLSDEDRDE